MAGWSVSIPPSVALLDSQSVRTTEVGGAHGFDGGKMVNGRKRHLLVDTMGTVLQVVAHAANSGEREGAQQVLNPVWARLVKILADGRHDGAPFSTWVRETCAVALKMSLRPRGAKDFVLLPPQTSSYGCIHWLSPL